MTACRDLSGRGISHLTAIGALQTRRADRQVSGKRQNMFKGRKGGAKRKTFPLSARSSHRETLRAHKYNRYKETEYGLTTFIAEESFVEEPTVRLTGVFL